MPRYKHDCNECVYLGQMNEFDIWYHERINTEAVLIKTEYIARYSDEPADYVCKTDWQFRELGENISGLPNEQQRAAAALQAFKFTFSNSVIEKK